MKKVKLGEVATFINGYAFKPQDWSSEGKEIIRIQNLTKTSTEINYYLSTRATKSANSFWRASGGRGRSIFFNFVIGN